MEGNELNRQKAILFHVMAWSAMILYLMVAPDLYARFFVRDGMPLTIRHNLPPATDQILYAVDRLDLVILHGQSGYNLRGWAFIKEEADQSVYDRYVVLHSKSQMYFFPTKVEIRPGVQETFESLNLNVLHSGYRTYIAKDAVPRGSYQVGIVFVHKANETIHFVSTNKFIERTANHISLSLGQSSQ
jgi:hypothetical protein